MENNTSALGATSNFSLAGMSHQTLQRRVETYYNLRLAKAAKKE